MHLGRAKYTCKKINVNEHCEWRWKWKQGRGEKAEDEGKEEFGEIT